MSAPPAFAHPLNAAVLAYLAEGATPRAAPGHPAWDLDGYVLRTHPDLSEALVESAGPRGREFAGAAYGVVVLHAGDLIVAAAPGMRHLLYRLPPESHPFAVEMGGRPAPEAGADWLVFDAWDADVPRRQHQGDLAYWCERAFAWAHVVRR
ncbi:MAG TPA: hypothetical protein VEA38_10405 [Terriglobales bacterium]|nr:hypothetical protein [Terriglobales bacterium]